LRGSLLSPRTQLVIVALDARSSADRPRKNTPGQKVSSVRRLLGLHCDQLLHLLTVGVAAWLLSPPVPLSELGTLLQNSRAFPNRFLAVPVVYVGVIFAGDI